MLALCLVPLLVVAIAAPAQSIKSGAEGPRYARIDPTTVQLHVVDGDDVRFSRLSQPRGVSQTRVTAIVQDQRGFMWFATQYGLNRYDGYFLKQFKHQDSDPRSVSDSYVTNLLIDHLGRLWVGSRLVVDRYDPTTESFIHYPLERGARSEPTAAAYHPNHISEGPDGSLWISTGGGLFRLDPTTGQTTGFHHRAGDPTSLSSEFIESSAVDRRGTLWVATPEGLDAFDPVTQRVTIHVPIHEPREMSFYEDRSGTFWILHSSGDGLAVLDRASGVVTQFSFAERAPNPDELTGVISMVEDADGQLWIGTQSDGLLKLDSSRRQATRYRNDPFNSESLAENRITTLARDREGEMWVGLGASEPNHFSPHPSPFQALPFDVNDRDNLGERLVNVLYEDHEGTLWVGTTGTLTRYHRATRRYERIRVPGRNSDVLAIVEEQPGVLWVGTSGQGLARLELATGHSRLYRHRSGDVTSLSDDTVIHLLIDHSGTLWAATQDGLNRYDAATERFRTFRSSDKGFSIYTSLVEDANHTLWISGAEGVLHFDPATERFLEFDQGRVARGYSVLAATSGEIWAGAQTGLYRFNPITHTTRTYTDSDGLSSSAISCLLEDASGDIWMSTTEGVSRLRVATDRFRNYSVQDGLPGRDLTGWNACSRSRNGELFFGGFAGAVAFDPRTVVDSPYTPQVVLTGFELAGIPVQLGPNSPLEQAIGYVRSLRLNSSQRTFALEFAALSFRSPATNRYRYRLLGLDSIWHEVGSERRIASYTTLPPGTYTFEVQGATNRSPWGDPASIAIVIDGPWWARWEFRAFMTALVLALVVSVYLYRVQRITRALEVRFAERVRERTRIARDLHDSLLQGMQGLTLKFHALARTMPPESPARASIETNLRQARELIEEVRTRVGDLRNQEQPRAGLADLLQEFNDAFPERSGAAFQISVVGATRALDPLAFEEVFFIGREAISNAIRHAEATHITVELTYTAKELALRVSDDGKGIESSTLETGRQGHWGLQGMRERARALGAVLEVWSRPGAGTDIELVVPGMIAYDPRRSTDHKTFLQRLLTAIAGRRWPW